MNEIDKQNVFTKYRSFLPYDFQPNCKRLQVIYILSEAYANMSVWICVWT